MLSQRTLQMRLSRFGTKTFDAAAHTRLRLRTLVAIALLKLIYFLGGAWDIQWHMTVGRDSLFVPPHLVAAAGWFACVSVALLAVAYETYLGRAALNPPRTLRLGQLRSTLPLAGVLVGFLGAAVAIFFDDLWHRVFGLDAKLWSPPHLALMFCTGVVDASLLVGIAAAARQAGERLTMHSPYFWALLLPAALLFDNLRFALGEGIIVGFQAGGAGLLGLLYPIMMGALGPLPLLLAVGLTGRLWLPALIVPLVILLQTIGILAAQLGFVLLRPVSQMSEFLAENPQSTIGTTIFFCQLNGFALVGFQELWVTALSLPSAALLAALAFWPWARRNHLVAAPLHAVALAVSCAIWFRLTPATANYPTTLADLALAGALAVAGSLLAGYAGLWLARLGKV